MKFDNNTIALMSITAIAIISAFVLGVNSKEIIIASISSIGGFIGGVVATKSMTNGSGE